VGDLERLTARICTGRAGPRDVAAIRGALEILPAVQDLLVGTAGPVLTELAGALDPLEDLAARIRECLAEDPPATVSAGVVKEGFSERLDEERGLARSGKDWLARLQQEEIERTGISSLKVGYNKVFGYYLEVTNTHKDKVPEHYIRKQTLVNAERYITPELKDLEERILSAEETILRLEQEIFEALRLAVAEYAGPIQKNASLIAELDCYASLAAVAAHLGYVRPEIDESDVIEIVEGRHPVVEHVLPDGEAFIPNDAYLSASDRQILIITGPNMAGKSVVLRQVGLIALLAQIGSFVPAARARIGVVDRIFTRVGASDNLAAGESTFLVEMNEAANILNNATTRSLILLDEIGRGTSTFDGLSIAWALVEYLHDTSSVRARTLFATHYHELNDLSEHFDRIHNYRIQVREHEGRVIFLRKLVPGGADHSYGIEVARMAGLPDEVIVRARDILARLEGQHQADAITYTDAVALGLVAEPRGQMGLFESDPVDRKLRDEVESLDPDAMTPIDALLKLAELKKLTRSTEAD
jgi:DNA mismatch repair protein MutS